MGMSSVSGQVVIVTGAGHGIGLSIVQQLLAEDEVAFVVAIDIKVDELGSIHDQYPSKLEIVNGDISERATSQFAVERAAKLHGRIDSLILNAGMLQPVGPVADTSVEHWKRLFDVNFFALLHTIQTSIPYLRQSSGKVIMTSSGVSLIPYQGWIAYACAKSAMNYLCSSLSLEEPQIAFICITPGIVDTGMQKEVRDHHQNNLPIEQYNWLKDLYAKGGLLRPEQPARSFVHLAVNGIPPEIVGTVVPWDDSRIALAQ